MPGVALWLGSAAAGSAAAGEPGGWGVVVGADFWDGDSPVSEADLVLATVPAQADPEVVMKRVRALALMALFARRTPGETKNRCRRTIRRWTC